MKVELITREDLFLFKEELILEIQGLLESKNKSPKLWIKSSEVRKILSISPGTLQNLRVHRKIHFNKIGGILYYKHEDVMKLLEGNEL